MRLLHTSDWHLGQHFMGKSRQAEHQALIGWLLEQVEAQAVDAVLIAGDIFDTGTPPSYARELYSQLVVRLHEAGVALLLLAGNHDSPATLGESRELLARLGTTVIAAAQADAASQVVVLPQRNGEPGCLVCAVPFVRPRDVLQSQAGQSAEDKQLSLQHAIQQHYAAVHAAALATMKTLPGKLPIVATGHLTTVGASASESVREIYVGALEAFPTSAFPPADYIALGHIHRPQKVGGHEHIRYCGAPLPLSFDEAKQQQEMLLVDLDSDGLKTITPLPVPRFQGLVAVSGNLDTLAGAIGAAAAAGTRERPTWLEVTVAEDDYLADLPARIEALTDGWPVEVLRIRRQRGTATARLDAAASETLDELDPHDVFARRLQQEELSEELQQALSDRYRAIVAGLQGEDA
ncbi:MAG: exonuclease subunit SbcD [Betaproteobacteria bacterium HGW-Betaproteobacteria-12]|nr:MAG: exonuclease subunit SbcD [Betaproteobacteria bacterium HGW-Betaproteobacteria-12]